MSKATYPTKYQLEHLKKRINSEIDPLIDQARLSVKSIIANLTDINLPFCYLHKVTLL